MARRLKTSGRDIAALLALIGIAILFLFIVARGWQTLLSGYGLYLSIVVAFVIAMIAVILSWAIAAERVNNNRNKSTAAAYFFVLFNISALGTVNAMLVMFQSSNVLREELDKAADSVIALKDHAFRSIDVSDFAKFQSDVNDRWRNLKAELENPALCGQGSVAIQRINEIQQVLPNFRPLAVGGRCDKIPEVVNKYRDQIQSLTRESNVFLQNRDKLILLESVDSRTKSLLEQINAIRQQLNGSYSLMKIKGEIHHVAEEYGQLRQEILTTGVANSDRIPSKIDVGSISALGDIGQVLPFIMSRMGHISTYVYLAIALILDLALIAAFSRVVSVGPSREQAARAQKIRSF